ncbi:MAG: [FeFe] hydrogenase H-cluster radical SAM maturase HydE, partial [Candidatus Omnitrophota bacterium]
DRYLLKIETSNKKHYEKLHPGMSYSNRIRCIKDLFALGYQVGSGNIVGLQGQKIEDIADDIVFFKKYNFGMLAIGPFIPHYKTSLSEHLAGEVFLTLKLIAVARICNRFAHIPAVSALGRIRLESVSKGANVVMINFTPEEAAGLYDIYPRDLGSNMMPGIEIDCIKSYLKGRADFVSKARGDCMNYFSGEAVSV